MLKKIPKTVLYTVVIAIVALFAATEVIAQGAVPTCTVCGVYEVSLEGNPIDGEWKYIIKATQSELSKLNRAVIFQSEVDFIKNPIVNDNGVPIGTLGEGDSATKWAIGIHQGATVHFTPQVVPGSTEKQRFVIDSRSNQKSAISLILDTGKNKIQTCETAIAGPGWEDIVPTRNSQQYTKEFCKLVDDVMQCVTCEFELVQGADGKLLSLNLISGPCEIFPANPASIEGEILFGGDAEYMPDGLYSYAESPGKWCGVLGGNYQCICW